MIAQQRLRLIQQLSFVFGAGTLITPPQLLQDLLPCRLIYHFIHSRHGNSHFWRNVSFSPSLQPLPGNKTFGAIRTGGWWRIVIDYGAKSAKFCLGEGERGAIPTSASKLLEFSSL